LHLSIDILLKTYKQTGYFAAPNEVVLARARFSATKLQASLT